MEIIKEEIVYNNRFIVEQALIRNGNDEYTRLRLNREDASVVLVVNTENKKIVLTRQFRYAVAAKSKERILEIVAGKLDKKEEDPLKTAIRETEEEVGYRVAPENLHFMFSCFVSPGYTSEKFYFYYALVTNADKVNKGGGLENEHEYIEVVEMDTDEFKRLIEEGGIQDAKTYTAGLYALLKKII